jgi:Tfp pilus assembly protein PilO
MTPAHPKSKAAHALVRTGLARLRNRQQRSMLGPAEFIGLGVSAILLLTVAIAYFSLLIPAKLRQQHNRDESDRLQKQLTDNKLQAGKAEDTKTIVERINQSVVDFETKRLVRRDAGRTDLYETVNELIKQFGLRNTAGPTFSNLEPIEDKVNGRTSLRTAKAGDERWKSVFPAIASSVTVEGTYDSLFKFVRELESTDHFIVITGLELESTNEGLGSSGLEPIAAGPQTQVRTQPTAKSSPISLRIDMVAYYRRDDTQ